MAMSKPQILTKATIISTFLHLLIVSAKSSPADQVLVNLPTLLNSPKVPNPLPVTNSQLQQEFSSDPQEYVAAHNDVRRRKGVPPLQWDEKLAKYAQDWAVQRIDDCDHKHHSGGEYGENTVWEKYDEYTPARVTQVWTDEEKNYDHVGFDCKCKPETSQCMCGHYTQVVWSSTQRVGCGNVTCNNELGLLVVCSYDPPGNYVDENPFQTPDNVATQPAAAALESLPPPPITTLPRHRRHGPITSLPRKQRKSMLRRGRRGGAVNKRRKHHGRGPSRVSPAQD